MDISNIVAEGITSGFFTGVITTLKATWPFWLAVLAFAILLNMGNAKLKKFEKERRVKRKRKQQIFPFPDFPDNEE